LESTTAETDWIQFDFNTNALQLVQTAQGSAGVVHLEFNRDQTRLVGSAFGSAMVDVWDIADGNLNLLKQIPSNDPLGPNAARQDAPHPHQALLDNTGRFFVVNDLGTDTLLVIDSENDQFEVVNRVRVTPDGCGPRHGAFFPRGATAATHYMVLCELLNLVQVFQLTYADNNLQFFPVQVLSTFGQDLPPANLSTATAGEIVVSSDNLDVYVSNRNTGFDTDSISHFRVVTAAPGGPISLEFSESTSSGGQVPRMFSLSADETALFSTNQNTGDGVVVLARNQNGQAVSLQDIETQVETAGTLVDGPIATVPNTVFGAENAGPQFIMQVPAPA
jgi:6-phosphogluconolactonase (cycloisomerase 2 family)